MPIDSLSRRAGEWKSDARPGRAGNGVMADQDETSKLAHLQKQDIFSPLTPDERVWLMGKTTMVSYQRGDVLYGPDDVRETVYILKQGTVDLYRLTDDGRKFVIATLRGKTVFGDLGLFGQRLHGCFAEAREDCLICNLSRSNMQGIIRRNPDVGLRILAEVERRLQEREAELEALAFHGLPARLAALLVREANGLGTLAGYSHQDLADRLGTHRETVSSILGSFRRDGLVATGARRIRLLDIERLRRRVGDA